MAREKLNWKMEIMLTTAKSKPSRQYLWSPQYGCLNIVKTDLTATI